MPIFGLSDETIIVTLNYTNDIQRSDGWKRQIAF